MSARFLFIAIAFLTLMDSMLGALVFRITGSIFLANIILFSKYAIFGTGFILFLTNVAAGRGFLRHEFYGLLYLLVMGVMIVVLTLAYPDQAVANRFYSYVFPIIIYFFGSWMTQVSSLDWRAALKIYLTLHISANIFFGVPVYLFGAEFFWKDIVDYGAYVIEVKGFDDVIGGLPGNFFYDPYFTRVIRYVGSLGDPLAVGYSSMILAIASWYSYGRWRYVLTSLFLMFIFLAITRAAFIGVVIGIAGFWFLRRWSFPLILAASTGGLVLIFEFGQSVADLLGDSSTEGHVESIGQIVRFATPQALIGGTLLSGRSTVFEPGFLNILFSFGIIPVILLLVFMYGIFRQHADDSGPTQFVSAIMLAGLATLMIFSPSFFAITSSWFAWFVAGATSRKFTQVAALAYERQQPASLPAMASTGR